MERDRSERENMATQSAPIGSIVMLTPPAETMPEALGGPAPPTREALIRQIRAGLKRVGCYAGRLDDKWSTSDMTAAVRRFEKYAGLPVNTIEPTTDLLRAIQSKTDRICPIICGAGEVERNGRCVAKKCPDGSSVAIDGGCSKRGDDIKNVNAPAAPLSSNSTKSCSQQRDHCIDWRRVRGPAGSERLCVTAFNACIKSGVWDATGLFPYGGARISGMARR
jgi:hypothetical protein